MHNIAFCVDSTQTTEKASKTLTNVRAIKDVEVEWCDGTKSRAGTIDHTHKIIYIPQTYLNRLVEEKQKVTEIDRMVRDILVQDNSISQAEEEMLTAIKNTKVEIDKCIFKIISELDNYYKVLEKRLDLGNSIGIVSSIDGLKKKKTAIQKELEISATLIEDYDILLQNIERDEKLLHDLEADYNYLVDYFFVDITISNLDNLRAIDATCAEALITQKVDTLKKEVSDIIRKLSDKTQDLINSQSSKLESAYNEKKIKEPLVNKSLGLTEFDEKISAEKYKLIKVIELEQDEKSSLQNIKQLIATLVESALKFKNFVDDYIEVVNSTRIAASNLDVVVERVFRIDDVKDEIAQNFDSRTLNRFSKCALKSFSEEDFNDSTLTCLINDILFNTLDKIQLKSNVTKENSLRNLLSNWYKVSYTVTDDNDSVNDMSPGKKALLMLKLLIGLAQSKCPILIDQPEDDLDNRSIFDDLVSYIKNSKVERQMIIATHNANIVVGGDAEEVIVANQQGRNSKNKGYRFEYRSGSLENDSCVLDDAGVCLDGILNQKGIQTHICDILEGGTRAFELRRKKYQTNS